MPHASKLLITTQPSSTAASTVVFAQQPVIQLATSAGVAVHQSGVVVNVSIASGNGTLEGTLSATTDSNGQATFTDLKIAGVSGNRTLQFSSTGLTGIVSNTIAVAETKFAMTTQPSSTTQSTVAFGQQPVVQLTDSVGTAVHQSGVVVSAAIASGNGTLGGTITATTDSNGQAAFTNLKISGVIGDRTLQFTATGVTSVTSNTVTVTFGPAVKLAFLIQPSGSYSSGQVFDPQPLMQVEDLYSNRCSISGYVVTASISVVSSGSDSGSLEGTLNQVTNANGSAQYTDLDIVGSGTFQLHMDSPPLSPAVAYITIS